MKPLQFNEVLVSFWCDSRDVFKITIDFLINFTFLVTLFPSELFAVSFKPFFSSSLKLYDPFLIQKQNALKLSIPVIENLLNHTSNKINQPTGATLSFETFKGFLEVSYINSLFYVL